MMRARLLALLAVAIVLAPLTARADRDAVQFGDDIRITADKPVKDAVCFFCSVHLDGHANGDVVVFFGNTYINGEAHHDVVNFFGNVTAADNSTIGGDMVSFFGSVQLGENVTVQKDLVALFGALHAPDSASVGGDRVVQSGWVISLPPLIFIVIILVIVHEIRAYRRRQLLSGFPYPPLR
jgi:hypothetical protein